MLRCYEPWEPWLLVQRTWTPYVKKYKREAIEHLSTELELEMHFTTRK